MNIFKKSLFYKLILLVLLITVVPIACIGGWSYWSGSKALGTQFLTSFQWVALSKAQAVKRYLIAEMNRVEDFSADLGVNQLLEQYTSAKISGAELSQKLNQRLMALTKATHASLKNGYYETLVIDIHGHVLASTRPELAGTHQFSEDFLISAAKKSVVSDVYKHPSTGEIGFLVATPIQQDSGAVQGILVNRNNLDDLNVIVPRGATEFGESGEYYLVNKSGLRITKSRFNDKKALEEEINTESVRAFREKHEAYNGFYPDYRNISVLGVTEWKIIDEAADNIGWLFVVEMDTSEVNLLASRLSQEIALFGVGTVVISLLIGILFGRSISAPIKESVEKFFATSNELSSTADQHQRTAAQQAVAVNQTTTTMDELGRSAQQSLFQAESANSAAKQAITNARNGARAMAEMLTSIEELSRRVENIGTQILNLSEHTSRIGHVTGAVKDIANQTNLLALNAAVEATRAGEYGKGFTVVSQEIRKLADQSKKSAEQISNLVDTIQKGTNATVLATEAGTQTTRASEEQVKHAKQSFDLLLDSVNNIAEVLQQISLTAQQQSNATNQVTEAMAMINNGAQETASGITQSKKAIEHLNKAAERLQVLV